MKIYTLDYDMAQRIPQTVYASKYSSFKIGLNVPNASSFKLYYKNEELTPEASLFHGYKVYQFNAEEPCKKAYKLVADGAVMPLIIVITDSNAAELNDKDTQYDLPIASDTTLGGIKVGDNLAIAADGTLSAAAGGSYELPVATSDTLGGIKIGYGLSADENGVLSATEPGFYKLNNDLSINIGSTNTTLVGSDNNTNVVLIGRECQRVGTVGYGGVAIGFQAKANTSAIGLGQGKATGDSSIAIGNSASATAYRAIAIGNNQCEATADGAIAIGGSWASKALATDAVQIGRGENTVANTLQFNSYLLVDANGYIPQDRAGNILSTVTEVQWGEISATAVAGKIYFVTEA